MSTLYAVLKYEIAMLGGQSKRVLRAIE